MRDSLRRLFFAVALVAAGGAVLSASPAEAQWAKVRSAESKIRLTHPIVENTQATYTTRQQGGSPATQHAAMYQSPETRLARALVVYEEISSGDRLHTPKDPDQIANLIGQTRGAKPEFSESFDVITGTRQFTVRRFSSGADLCFAFTRTWDQGKTEIVEAGNRATWGFACANPNDAVANDTIADVLSGLAINEG
ncbi:hypothetical protein T8K17_09465 [Thalassobaculum sp. OXR-137]|uniref:hypothetical protein n=1 Tax=Thalassobaculum sp. OXR-137 TaxID=3100173 RepID=UPI002AC8C5B2|nr:hypothetical protein [Thalassobaculum sp. OXR-137]WPZ36364.1 hypothetical protein T8K17_09465 [Thalassobaculum sp. OXR-137]